jgi:hypothetical protein
MDSVVWQGCDEQEANVCFLDCRDESQKVQVRM